jgi:cytochrome c biogenesis protein CcdA/glutaredoxin-related protein
MKNKIILITLIFLILSLLSYKIIFSKNSEIIIYYFYIEGCPECARVKPYLETLEARFNNLKITKLNIAEKENQELRAKIDDYYNVPEDKKGVVPAIFIGKSFYIREKDIFDNLNSKIENFDYTENEFLLNALKENISGKEKIKEYFEKFGLYVILVAGLIDGVNPCAFAVLIFFITFLLTTGRKKEDILKVGISFTIGVFIAYLLSGVGLFRFIQRYSIVGIFSKILYIVTAILVLIFATLSLIDYYKIKIGKGEEITLQLPGFFKKSAREIIKKNLNTSFVALSAFLVAFPVSIIEFLCTGQTYLPTIVYIVGVPELRTKGIFYLIAYNFMFVLPLIIIFLGVYFGLSQRVLGKVMRENVGKIKLITSIIFFILGGYLIYLVLKSFGIIF